MNWVRENKFLSGFIAVVVIGVGALGYLLFTAWGAYSDTTDEYNAAAGQLHQLQTLTPYPDQPNLAKYKAELDDLKDATHDLAAQLSTMVLPVKEISPSEFQNQLRDTMAAIADKASRTGVKIPGDRDKPFALDFDQYQQQQPPAVAAGPLGRQLTAMNMAVNILLDSHVDAITSLGRTKLPEEGGAPAPGASGHPAPRPAMGAPAANAPELVQKNSFDVKFSGDQIALQNVINAFAASSKQFFITRDVVVENNNAKPVSKMADTTNGAAGAAAAPSEAAGTVPGSAAASGTEAPELQYIVGTEKLNVAMRVEMVTFNPPEKSNRK